MDVWSEQKVTFLEENQKLILEENKLINAQKHVLIPGPVPPHFLVTCWLSRACCCCCRPAAASACQAKLRARGREVMRASG